MSNNPTFQLDINAAGKLILEQLSTPLVEQSAAAIASRAGSMANSVSTQAPAFSVSTKIGTIKTGSRAIATVTAKAANEHQEYVGHMALTKAADAGRV